MNLSAVKFLYTYNDWANQRILTQAAKLNPEELRRENSLGWGSFLGGLVHIMVAESLWTSRLFDEPVAGSLEPDDLRRCGRSARTLGAGAITPCAQPGRHERGRSDASLYPRARWQDADSQSLAGAAAPS